MRHERRHERRRVVGEADLACAGGTLAQEIPERVRSALVRFGPNLFLSIAFAVRFGPARYYPSSSSRSSSAPRVRSPSESPGSRPAASLRICLKDRAILKAPFVSPARGISRAVDANNGRGAPGRRVATLTSAAKASGSSRHNTSRATARASALALAPSSPGSDNRTARSSSRRARSSTKLSATRFAALRRFVSCAREPPAPLTYARDKT